MRGSFKAIFAQYSKVGKKMPNFLQQFGQQKSNVNAILIFIQHATSALEAGWPKQSLIQNFRSLFISEI